MDEILVHIAAPSTAHDDARYRAQVAAILDFQAASRYAVIENSNQDFQDHQDQHHQPHLLSDLSHELSASRPAEYPLQTNTNTNTNQSNSTASYSFISVIPDSQDQQIAQLVPETLQDPPTSINHAIDTDHPDLASISSSLTSNSNANSNSHADLSNHDLNLDLLPLEIHPPRPPISSTPFKTHITPTLSMLTERLKPSRTYNPSSQSRELDPLERGYWFVRFRITDLETTSNRAGIHTDQERERDPTTSDPIWPAPLFRAFWSFLSEFVGRDGRAGWGVWCILERDLGLGQVTLKVYAWGEVVMHVYLLLFLASERRIRGMGAQWRDYREEVVVQMP
jgi:hypothetical protein